MVASGHVEPDGVIAIVISLTLLACVFVGLKLYARLGMARIAGMDDLCVGISMFFALGTTVTMVIQAKTGMGRHTKDIDPNDIQENLIAFWISTWIYNLSLTFTKFSILFQYLRLFPQRWFRRATWGLMAFIAVYGVYVLCTGIWLCRPAAFFWDSTIKGGKCLDRFTIWFINAGMNMATDIATTIFPLPVLNKLELPKRQKYALMFVFTLGLMTCILSILRLQSLYVIANAEDVSWHNPLAAIWSSAEMNTAIIASCLPTIRLLVPRLLKATSLGGSRSHPTSTDRSWGRSASGGGSRSAFSMRKFSRPTTRGGTSLKNPYQSMGDNSTTEQLGATELVDKSDIQVRAQETDFERGQHLPVSNGGTRGSIEHATHHAERIGRESVESTKDLKKPADCI